MQEISQLNIEQRRRLSRAGLTLFFALADTWNLKTGEQMLLLGLSSRGTIYSWKKRIKDKDDISLSPNTIERLSLIAGIRKGIEILYPKKRWDTYLRQPNRHFAGRSPLDIMLLGNVSSLLTVRRYIDASLCNSNE